MRSLPLIVFVAASLIGCMNEIGGGSGGGDTDDSLPVGGSLPVGDGDDSEDPDEDDDDTTGPAADEPEPAPEQQPEPAPEAAPEPDVQPEPAPEPEDPPAQQCDVWQDCGPNYSNPNSGFDCVDDTCQCDATGQWATACSGMGGQFIIDDCLCVFTDTAFPNDPPPEDCYWHLEEGVCDAELWIDTSHYEEDCYYDAQDVYQCDSYWIESGYYEDGACPDPYWIPYC